MVTLQSWWRLKVHLKAILCQLRLNLYLTYCSSGGCYLWPTWIMFGKPWRDLPSWAKSVLLPLTLKIDRIALLYVRSFYPLEGFLHSASVVAALIFQISISISHPMKSSWRQDLRRVTNASQGTQDFYLGKLRGKKMEQLQIPQYITFSFLFNHKRNTAALVTRLMNWCAVYKIVIASAASSNLFKQTGNFTRVDSRWVYSRHRCAAVAAAQPSAT